ncbi:PTS sugar transporter subunit IIA [Treponema sp.]|uniref:PTS sugar transporter subunit IIA n=1 Tax=Treponema sp. TaxID=166 RepID=UPI00298DA41E|nr:PTS sugar transporter subunit IIA [Treponema sp.]MCR5613184.1 PTS sugar transporter subunit IIA [Treponema sp.]
MENKNCVADLIKRGGVIKDVEGNSTSEIYKNICNVITLPEEVTKEGVYAALCDRERVLSTAIGYGIALPHCRGTILKDNEDQQITVCYLKEPIDMNAPDARFVNVMFVLLTSNSQTHLQVLSQLATLFKDSSFKQLLEKHAGAEELVKAAQEIK